MPARQKLMTKGLKIRRCRHGRADGQRPQRIIDMEITNKVVITGKVVEGNHIGRQLDVPTANLNLSNEFTDLPKGVYYSRTTISQKTYKSITNIGTKPTVKDDSVINAETFVFDFEGDLYGREISVELLGFRRAERKFSSLDELSQTIKEDLRMGRNYQSCT